MKGCPIGNCTSSSLCLNATSLSPDSFLISLMSAFSCSPLQALLDSGSSHSFVDEMFAHHNKLTLAYLPEPIPLRLFNGSSNSYITSKTRILITMLTGETHNIELFVTKLDKGYSLVLRYDWLQQHNPVINWDETKVIFRKPLVTPRTDKMVPTPINIQQVSEKTLKKLSQEPGSTTFFISKTSDLPSEELEVDIPPFPLEYQEFADVFSGEKANTLPPHRTFDLQINTEGEMKPFYGPIYSLSQPELTALCQFLVKNT